MNLKDQKPSDNFEDRTGMGPHFTDDEVQMMKMMGWGPQDIMILRQFQQSPLSYEDSWNRRIKRQVKPSLKRNKPYTIPEMEAYD
jgi:hypothetical protein